MDGLAGTQLLIEYLRQPALAVLTIYVLCVVTNVVAFVTLITSPLATWVRAFAFVVVVCTSFIHASIVVGGSLLIGWQVLELSDVRSDVLCVPSWGTESVFFCADATLYVIAGVVFHAYVTTADSYAVMLFGSVVAFFACALHAWKWWSVLHDDVHAEALPLLPRKTDVAMNGGGGGNGGAVSDAFAKVSATAPVLQASLPLTAACAGRPDTHVATMHALQSRLCANPSWMYMHT